MLKSLHIGRYVSKPADFRVLTGFLEAIGFERIAAGHGAGESAVFSAPLGLLSVNALPSEYPKEFQERLKDVNRLIVIEVANPDAVFELAKKRQLKLLADSSSAKTGERSFSLELPGDVIVTVHGKPAELPAGIEGQLDAKGKRFAVIISRFNSFITERLLQGALDGLRRCGARGTDIEIVRVPGAFEIPSAARTLAETKKYNAIICLGCLLRGDTAHYDVIVNEVTRGIGQSAQETGVPHAFGVLTCENLEQAIDRAGLKMGNKGFEAALAAVEMASLTPDLRPRTSDLGTAASRRRASRQRRSKKQSAKRSSSR